MSIVFNVPAELHRVRISREKQNETPDSTTAPHRSSLRDPLPEGRRADQRMDADAPSRNRTATDSEMDRHAGTSNELRRYFLPLIELVTSICLTN